MIMGVLLPAGAALMAGSPVKWDKAKDDIVGKAGKDTLKTLQRADSLAKAGNFALSRVSSTRWSGVTTNWNACSRCCAAAPRTTRC